MNPKPKTRTKACGIRTLEELGMAVENGADAVGFITEVPVNSSRKVSRETAAALSSAVPETVDSVLVIMPSTCKQALELVEKVKPDLIQVHCEMPFLELEDLREKTCLPLIKALHVPTTPENSRQEAVFGLLEKVRRLEEAELADYILLDSGNGNDCGGTGLVHDWALSRLLVKKTRLPVFLAGGLVPENVKEAILTVFPYAVDVASGVETDGRKDPAKIKKFIEEVRRADDFL